MSDAVLDSSAVLAFILDEPGGDKVAKEINGALVSSVNLAEVVGHFAKFGMSEAQIRDLLRTLPVVVVPFDETGAFETGLLRPLGEKVGLSLGDRALPFAGAFAPRSCLYGRSRLAGDWPRLRGRNRNE
jgi:PIN domain nuclease of toxin-antitoxin system